MDEAQTLFALLTAPTAERAASLALAALLGHFETAGWACFLLWDAELGRYIVGQTWIDPACASPLSPADTRRRALEAAQAAHAQEFQTARHVEPGLYYQPLDDAGTHVAALVVSGAAPRVGDDAAYDRLLRAIGRVIAILHRLEHADRERARYAHERERLEHLLQAVEQQQRTIDRLLAQERQLSASLEAKVEERTAALQAAQQRLIQSEKLAVIGQLASSLAHELNNPLQAIQSGLGLVVSQLKSGDLAQVENDLRIVQAELERIETIFRQMLDFYRPVSFRISRLDLNALCESIAILLHRRLEEAHAVLRLDLAETLPGACGDGNQIKQVLINLLLNAAEALPPEGGHIVVRTLHERDQVCISVLDDGCGIPDEHRARLFEPLFTTKTRGLGLGLAISQEIAERHGGFVAVQSAPQQGAVFTLYLPVREGCDEPG